MTILALDPGPVKTGFAVLFNGKPVETGILPNDLMLQRVTEMNNERAV